MCRVLIVCVRMDPYTKLISYAQGFVPHPPFAPLAAAKASISSLDRFLLLTLFSKEAIWAGNEIEILGCKLPLLYKEWNKGPAAV